MGIQTHSGALVRCALAASEFKPSRFSISEASERPPAPTKKSKQGTKIQGEFLKGPIPLWWLRQAAKLRGKALAVGTALWFRSGCQDSLTISGSHALWEKLGIGRRSVYAGLKALESAGLVDVQRHPGRNPLITINTEQTER
jgi:hypothetical protein